MATRGRKTCPLVSRERRSLWLGPTVILDLIRPAFEAKERGGVGNSDGIASPFNACCYRDECRAMEARALSEASCRRKKQSPSPSR